MNYEDVVSVFIKMRPSLYRDALYYTKNRDDAQDLVQDTFLKLDKEKDIIVNYESVKSALRLTLKRLYLNSLRSYKPQVEDVDDIQIPVYTTDSYLESKDIYSSINRLSNTLKPSMLMYLQGYKYREIGDILGIPEGTAKAHVCRSKKQLIKVL